MRYYWELVRHFLAANSRHGTHSPFVYALAEKVIYAKRSESVLTENLPADFSFHYATLLSELMAFMQVKGVGKYPNYLVNQAVWVDLREAEPELIKKLLSDGVLLIVHEPYRTKAQWKDLIADPAIVVAIDLFHFGILLHRTAQRKEYFQLRYPYWR